MLLLPLLMVLVACQGAGKATVGSPARPAANVVLIISDDAVGTVLDALDRNDIAENTLVVFVNDNGGQTMSGMDNTPLRGRKGQPYEGGIRVPFVARWPDRWPSGLVYDHPVSTLDLMPTALHAAGAGGEPGDAVLDGVDLTPWMTGEASGTPHEVLFWSRKKNFAVRAGDLKLLRNGNGPIELFDIDSDPNETRDLAIERPDDVARLQALFDAWNEGNAPPRW